MAWKTFKYTTQQGRQGGVVVREMAEEGGKPEDRTHRDGHGSLNHIEGREGGTSGWGTSWQKRACGAGLQGPTGTWGAERLARQQVQDGWWRTEEMRNCLDRRSKTGMREDNWLQRMVHNSLRVVNWRGGRDTEGEGGGSRE